LSLFSYEAVDQRGRRKQGEIEADSEYVARQRLKAQGLLPRTLEARESSAPDGLPVASGLKAEDTCFFFEQLATLLGAGMSLTESMATIAEGLEGKKQRQTVVGLRQLLLEGHALAEALDLLGFDELVCNMVAAGEETGQLEAVCSRLAELLSKRQQLRQDILSAVLYPVIVTGFGLLVMVFMLTVVVPQVVGVFERAGGELPWVTRFLITVSGGLRDYGPGLLVAMVIAVMVYRLGMRRPWLRRRRDTWLLRLPVAGTLLAEIETAHFSRTLGMLLAGGVPVLDAMRIASQSLSLIPVRETVADAAEALREGEGLAEQLSRSGFFPHLAVRLISVGEQSGTLDKMLMRVAENYEAVTTRLLKRLVTLLEPALVLVMAVMVGTIALAILLPIVDMNELVRR